MKPNIKIQFNDLLTEIGFTLEMGFFFFLVRVISAGFFKKRLEILLNTVALDQDCLTSD